MTRTLKVLGLATAIASVIAVNVVTRDPAPRPAGPSLPAEAVSGTSTIESPYLPDPKFDAPSEPSPEDDWDPVVDLPYDPYEGSFSADHASVFVWSGPGGCVLPLPEVIDRYYRKRHRHAFGSRPERSAGAAQ